MVCKGIAPDTVMYNTILDGAVRFSRFNLCDQLLKEMAQNSIDISNFTLSIIVKMWGKRRQLDKAFSEVRKHSQLNQMQLDSKLCTCLLSACFHNGCPERALQALEELKTLRNCDGPNGGTYEQLIEQLIKVKRSQEAYDIATEASKLAAAGSIKPWRALERLKYHLLFIYYNLKYVLTSNVTYKMIICLMKCLQEPFKASSRAVFDSTEDDRG